MKLTAEQLKAIKEYAAANGRNWKSALRHDWETGQSYGDLQQIRNSFGPSWLVNFRLPKVVA
jgi:hypothetical protein